MGSLTIALAGDAVVIDEGCRGGDKYGDRAVVVAHIEGQQRRRRRALRVLLVQPLCASAVATTCVVAAGGSAQ